MMLKRWIVLIFTMTIMLAACNSPVYNQSEANVADVKIRADAARHRSDVDARIHGRNSLRVNNGMYVDTTPIVLARTPSWLNNRIVIRGDQLPFSYYSRVIASGASNNVLVKMQPGMDPNTPISLSYTGTIRGALDMLASRAGIVYSLQGNKIYWQKYISKTFDIAFMPGRSDYMMGSSANTSVSSSSSGGSGGTVANFSGSSDLEYSTLAGKLSVWDDLKNSIMQMLSPEGKLFVSEATTSVTVRDMPSNIELVGQYIANLNHKLSKQVLVKVQILAVDLESDFDFGINWQLIANALHNTPFVLNGNYGTPVSITALTQQPTIGTTTLTTPQFGFNSAQDPNHPNGVPSWTALFNALNQQGKTSVVTEPRVVCLNNQPCVIRIIEQNGYVASIQNTSLSSGGSSVSVGIGTVTSQVIPGNLVTGLTLYILPKILKNDVYLQVDADISKNQSFGVFGPANSQIQLPNVNMKHFNQRSVIRSGDTLILSGFRQLQNQTGANQLLTSQALGGKAASQISTETIVLISPIILNGSA